MLCVFLHLGLIMNFILEIKRLKHEYKFSSIEPNGSKPKHLTIGRIGLYCFILMCALFFLMPLYVMIVTSLKDMDEIRSGNLLYIPKTLSFYAGQKLGRKHALVLCAKD